MFEQNTDEFESILNYESRLKTDLSIQFQNSESVKYPMPSDTKLLQILIDNTKRYYDSFVSNIDTILNLKYENFGIFVSKLLHICNISYKNTDLSIFYDYGEYNNNDEIDQFENSAEEVGSDFHIFPRYNYNYSENNIDEIDNDLYEELMVLYMDDFKLKTEIDIEKCWIDICKDDKVLCCLNISLSRFNITITMPKSVNYKEIQCVSSFKPDTVNSIFKELDVDFIASPNFKQLYAVIEKFAVLIKSFQPE
jgi:hypothetical protein